MRPFCVWGGIDGMCSPEAENMFDGKPGIYTGSVKVKCHPVLGANMFIFQCMESAFLFVFNFVFSNLLVTAWCFYFYFWV